MPGKVLADESIIGSILNGYETRNPYGKKAHRAAIIILTSLIDEHIAAGVAATLRSLYNTRHIALIAGGSLRYQAMRAAFPHERNALILDVARSSTSIALVRKNLFVAAEEITEGESNTDAWAAKVTEKLGAIAQHFPLPRTIFFLAQESHAAALRQALASSKFGSLWLSETPPNLVSVLPSHIVGSVRYMATTPPDLPLLLMALYWQYRAAKDKL